MNRFVRVAAAAALAVGGAGSLGCVSTGKTGGCDTGRCGGIGANGGGDGSIYRSFVDPCYPERYNVVARAETLAPFAAQVHNGHVLNQTVYNWHFDGATDQLNGAGKAKLDSIAQTRPGPDPRIYLQVARDIAPAGDDDAKVHELREELTAKRAAAVQRYMAAQPSIHPVAYEIFIHDPVVPSIRAPFAEQAFNGQLRGYVGGIGGAGASSAASGQPPPASAIGTGPGNGTGGGGAGTTGAPGSSGGGPAPGTY
jgi:hypothetical protein